MASRTAERRKQRYAEDPVFREKVLATNSAWSDRNREKINAQKRLRYNSDPELRARICAQDRANRPKNVYGLPIEDYERRFRAAHPARCGVRSADRRHDRYRPPP